MKQQARWSGPVGLKKPFPPTGNRNFQSKRRACARNSQTRCLSQLPSPSGRHDSTLSHQFTVSRLSFHRTSKVCFGRTNIHCNGAPPAQQSGLSPHTSPPPPSQLRYSGDLCQGLVSGKSAENTQISDEKEEKEHSLGHAGDKDGDVTKRLTTQRS